MTYRLIIENKPGYLHATVTGQNTRENVAGYIGEIIRECTARKCPNVLIEERLEGPRMGAFDVFDLASEAGSKASKSLRAVAYVDVNAVGDLMKFAETVAVNRWANVKVFDTVTDAEEWMRENDSRDPAT